MIAYDLQCGNGHRFEGWFDDERTYRRQKADGLLECPTCGTRQVHRIPSTFAIKSGAAVKKDNAMVKINPVTLAKTVKQFIDSQFDNVGSDFAKEALKIHYGAAEPRNIRGVSTTAEETMLEKEGVSFMKIPLPPDPPTDS